MFCPHCGRKNSETDTTCAQCGQSLVEAAQKLARSTAQSPQVPPPASSGPRVGTMLGVAVPPVGAPAPMPSVGPQVTGQGTGRVGTMMGIPVSQPPSQPPPAGPASMGNHPPTSGRVGTMMGIAVPAVGGVAPPDPRGPAAQPSQRPPVSPSQRPPASPSQQPPASPSHRPPPSMNQRPQATGRVGTMMGVAVPPAGAIAPPEAAPQRPQGDSLEGLLARALGRPVRAPAEVLVELLGRHGHAALGNRAGIEHELWGDYAPDVHLLLAALDEGVPQQLMARAQGGLQPAHIKMLARGLAETRGISDEAAEYAVAAWAMALRPMLGG